MNKEITKYELLGLVKDGQAPKKIKFREEIYNYYQEENFVNYKPEKHGNWLFNQYLWYLNDKVEIIEEDKKIEKLDIKQEKNCKGNWKWKCNEYNISTPQKILGDKINELIDEINVLKENNEK